LTEMTENWKEKLASELKKPLPGVDAQLRMSPEGRRPVSGEYPLKNAGVLILLYPEKDRLYTVFIKRTEYEGVHSGQVSLPGGMFKEEDGSLMKTAMREANEETGINVFSVTIIGQLTPLHIPVSNVNVQAYVGITDSRPDFVHDPAEVQYLIEESLDELLNEVNHKTKTMTLFGNEVVVPYFDIKGDHIWGATAMIISEFSEIVKRVTGDW
jgi:8-oxo-dGTP pyrophosphatase MutT (NUDIX family)